MATKESTTGVSKCYVFKSQLHEYVQKIGFPAHAYETIKEGPAHEPIFRSTVIVNDVRYDSLPGFTNRKAAEQSAAEVALVELAKLEEANVKIHHPLHETGLCKNQLQEYSLQMNYAVPVYECRRDETPGREGYFYCTVDAGGIRYIGGPARSKKEAEIKAARTALLAIQSTPSALNEKQPMHSQLTVFPSKRKVMESNLNPEPASKSLKAKKLKAKRRKKFHEKKANMQNQGKSVHSTGELMLISQGNENLCDQIPKVNDKRGEKSIVESVMVPRFDHSPENEKQTAANFIQSQNGTPNPKVPSMSHIDHTSSLQVNMQDHGRSVNSADGVMKISVEEGALVPRLDHSSENRQKHADLNMVQTLNGTSDPKMSYMSQVVTSGLVIGEVNNMASVEQDVRLADNSTLVEGMLQV